jgi:hypothetical protein
MPPVKCLPWLVPGPKAAGAWGCNPPQYSAEINYDS